MEDAFAAIDNGCKIRKPNELPFDICFGGRRQFCNSDYADLGETHVHHYSEGKHFRHCCFCSLHHTDRGIMFLEECEFIYSIISQVSIRMLRKF